MKERGLGKGLQALLATDTDVAQIVELETALIVAQKNQPRKKFETESLHELAQSIKEHGVLQPVLVRPLGQHYEIIAGERRWRAAKMASLETIPAVIRELDNSEAAEISLVENLQRADLSAIEEAYAYKNLLEKYNYTQEQVAERVGKSRVHIANTVRLLNLDPEIIAMVDKGQISPGHARALLALRDSRKQMAAAQEIIKNKLTVRQAEQKSKIKNNRINQEKSPDLVELEHKLQNHFGTKVALSQQRKGGKIEIGYYDEDDLERILEIIGL
jgi:ParB family chromosome partitioning protein